MSPAPDTVDSHRDWHESVLSPEIVEGLSKWIDFGLILIAAASSYTFYFGLVGNAAGDTGRYVLTSLLAAMFFRIGFRRIGGYSFKRLSMPRWQATRVPVVWGITVAVLLLFAFVGKESESYSRGWALSWMVGSLTLLFLYRSILRVLMIWWGRRGYLVRNVVIVGAGEPGQQLVKGLLDPQERTGIKILGFFDDRHARVPSSICGFDVLGTTDDLITFARDHRIDEVILALPLGAEQRIKFLFDKLRLLPVDLRLSAESIAGTLPIRGISYVGPIPILEIIDRPLKNWNAVTKLIEDNVLGLFLLALAAPLMAIVAILMKLDSKGPVFFVQERFGFNNNVIRVLKFRTMHADRSDVSGAQRTVRDDPRVTRVGRILRALSLDELPQLINVVRGDMSLVGPRPHATKMRAGDRLYHDAIATYLQRHRVKPGITGWAQVNGLRGEVDTLEKAQARVEHDLYYIEHWSLWLDLRILLETAPKILAQRDAY